MEEVLLSATNLFEKVPLQSLAVLVKEEQTSTIESLLLERKIEGDECLTLACIYNKPAIAGLIENVGRHHIVFAIKYDSIGVLRTFLERRLAIDVNQVIKEGTVKALSLLEEYGISFDNYNVLFAAECDRLDMFLFLKERGLYVDPNCCLIAGPQVLTWLCENGPYHGLMGKRVIELLGDASICDKLYKENHITYYDEESIKIAITKGDLRTIKWLHSLSIPLRRDISLLAAKHGHLRILDWLYSMNLPIGETEDGTPEIKEWYEKFREIEEKRKKGTIFRPYTISPLIKKKKEKGVIRRRSRSSGLCIEPLPGE